MGLNNGNHPQRGQIWRVNFDPTIGVEIKKTRPAVIISNDIQNQYSLMVTVLPISDKGQEVYPFEYFLSKETIGLTKDSKVRCQQIRAIDKRRLMKLLGEIDHDVLKGVEKALCVHLGL